MSLQPEIVLEKLRNGPWILWDQLILHLERSPKSSSALTMLQNGLRQKH